MPPLYARGLIIRLMIRFDNRGTQKLSTTAKKVIAVCAKTAPEYNQPKAFMVVLSNTPRTLQKENEDLFVKDSKLNQSNVFINDYEHQH